MKKILSFLLFFTVTINSILAQYEVLDKNNVEFKEIVEIISEWSDENYEECFNSSFFKLNDESIKVTRIKSGKWKVSGTLNSESETNKFKATLLEEKTGVYQAEMKIEIVLDIVTSVGGVDNGNNHTVWEECTKKLVSGESKSNLIEEI